MSFRRSLCMLGWGLAGFFFARWIIACGGAEFTSIDARAAGDAGEDLVDGAVSIRIPTGDAPAPLEAAAVDAGELLGDAARGDDHPVMTTDAGELREASTPIVDAGVVDVAAPYCNPSSCPPCPPLQSRCCASPTTCGCILPSQGGQCL